MSNMNVDESVLLQKLQQLNISLDEDLTQQLIQDYDRILSVGEECISATELSDLLIRQGRGSLARTVAKEEDQTEDNSDPQSAVGFNLYDGFEPSGRMHIAQGIFKARNVNKCTYHQNGGTFIFWIADWFALMNDKMGGDLEKIRIVGMYLIEVWKAAGMNLSSVVFKWASDEITNNAATYWPQMMDIARRFTVTRIKKCCQIMGRLENNLSAAQILYPIMQCTDVFFLKADICQLGVDQRKVNMLAREYCDYAKRKNKPIILSHHMLYGLKQGQEKMSKSDPDSAIFMEDTIEDVQRKIHNAYCPSTAEGETGAEIEAAENEDAGKASMHLTSDQLKNPCLDYIENIIFSAVDGCATFTVGATVYNTFAEVKTAFLNGAISEEALKASLVNEINKLLDPVRYHFTHDEHAKFLFDQVRQFKKESVATPTEKKSIRRLNLVELGKVAADSHIVMAPSPNTQPSLQEAMDVLTQLHQTSQTDQHKVLFLQDWSAIVCNACSADLKGIMAYYTVLITSLKALDPVFMESVQILYQSEAILADPSNYWISVINVGRHFMLHQVMGNDMEDSDGVGKVIARLMMVADVMGLEPAGIALSAKTAVTEQFLIEDYFKEKMFSFMKSPAITMVDCRPLRLQPLRESEALVTENDEYYLLDDPKVHGKSKMNKSFAEERNVDFCPALNVAAVFVFGESVPTPGTLTVQRSEENGGAKVYNNFIELVSDYRDGSLHPGDLKKHAMIAVAVGILERLSQAIQGDKATNQAAKTLKSLLKKKK